MNASQELAVSQAKEIVKATLKLYMATPSHENQKKYARACDLLYAAIYWPRDTLKSDINYQRLDDYLPEHEEEE